MSSETSSNPSPPPTLASHEASDLGRRKEPPDESKLYVSVQAKAIRSAWRKDSSRREHLESLADEYERLGRACARRLSVEVRTELAAIFGAFMSALLQAGVKEQAGILKMERKYLLGLNRLQQPDYKEEEEEEEDEEEEEEYEFEAVDMETLQESLQEMVKREVRKQLSPPRKRLLLIAHARTVHSPTITSIPHEHRRNRDSNLRPSEKGGKDETQRSLIVSFTSHAP